jgi:hypothetical protein
MTTIFDSARPVNPAFRTFGRGIPTGDRRPFVPDLEDLARAAQAFGDAEADRELEERALQAAWDDQFANAFPAGCCQICGEPSDELDPVHQLCPVCLDEAEFATIAGQNERAGLGYRVF